jgi:subtilisin family serine protease
MIMGANAYDEVLTLAGCDVDDVRVCYSSQGPSIAGMPPQKPNVTAYTQFLGSKIQRGPRGFVPDTGTSTACAVASGCVAALRTGRPPTATDPATMIGVLQATALPADGAVPNKDYGYGIVRPVAAGRSLGIIP